MINRKVINMEIYQTGTRKITNKGGKKIITYGYSVKMDIMVPFESTLERDFAYYAEFNDNVLSYNIQPIKIKIYYDGKDRTYTPDVRLNMKYGRPQIVEIKPDKKFEERKNFFEKAREEFNNQGYGFWVATESMIRVKPKLQNIKLLYRYASVPINKSSISQITDFLNEYSAPVSLRLVTKELLPYGVQLSHLYCLCFRGLITIDLNKPINLSSKIQINTNQMRENCDGYNILST